jgi:hypothetical protein
MEAQEQNRINKGQVAKVVAAARRRLQQFGSPAASYLAKQLAYFEHHQHRMFYKTARSRVSFFSGGAVLPEQGRVLKGTVNRG